MDPEQTLILIDPMAFAGILFLNSILMWFVSSCVCAYAANKKGYRAFWFFVLSLLASPIIGFLALIAFPQKLIVEQFDASEFMEKQVDEAFCDTCGRMTVVDGKCTNCNPPEKFKL